VIAVISIELLGTIRDRDNHWYGRSTRRAGFAGDIVGKFITQCVSTLMLFCMSTALIPMLEGIADRQNSVKVVIAFMRGVRNSSLG
jgi:uncharacterized membrane protein YraQ (UPF0718 family)